MNYKSVLSFIAICMMIAGYIPYLHDTIKGKTKPHVFSWFVGMVVAFIAFGLQLQEHSGPASFVTLSAAIISSVVVYYAYKNPDKDITPVDYICLGLSLLSLVAWLVADRPVLSMLLIVITETTSFIPTIRKSWKKPHSETLISYAINFFRFIIALLALDKYTFVAIGYPVTWLLLNGAFAVMLAYRREILKKN